MKTWIDMYVLKKYWHILLTLRHLLNSNTCDLVSRSGFFKWDDFKDQFQVPDYSRWWAKQQTLEKNKDIHTNSQDYTLTQLYILCWMFSHEHNNTQTYSHVSCTATWNRLSMSFNLLFASLLLRAWEYQLGVCEPAVWVPWFKDCGTEKKTEYRAVGSII